jgi:hypothetical protein
MAGSVSLLFGTHLLACRGKHVNDAHVWRQLQRGFDGAHLGLQCYCSVAVSVSHVPRPLRGEGPNSPQ